MSSIFIIPARKGSKGLIRKNVKLLNGKPLINYSIEFALKVKKENDIICVSTNDEEAFECSKLLGVVPPFIRPEYLSNDTASTSDVVKHCLDFYESKNIFFDSIVILQPTSPIRSERDFFNMMQIFLESKSDMTVSVVKPKHNPYFSLFQVNNDGYLISLFLNSIYTRRQDCPDIYAYNGSMYIISVASFKRNNRFDFNKIVKYEMNNMYSIDIDNFEDWELAEYFINKTNENH